MKEDTLFKRCYEADFEIATGDRAQVTNTGRDLTWAGRYRRRLKTDQNWLAGRYVKRQLEGVFWRVAPGDTARFGQSQYLLSASAPHYGGSTGIYELPSGVCLASLPYVTADLVAASKQHFALSKEHVIDIYEWSAPKREIKKVNQIVMQEWVTQLAICDKWIIAVTPGLEDTQIRCFDLVTGTGIWDQDISSSAYALDLVINPTTKTVYIMLDFTVSQYELATGKKINSHRIIKAGLFMRLSEERREIWIVTPNRSTVVLDTLTLQKRRHRSQFDCDVLHVTRNVVAANAFDGPICVYNKAGHEKCVLADTSWSAIGDPFCMVLGNRTVLDFSPAPSE